MDIDKLYDIFTDNLTDSLSLNVTSSFKNTFLGVDTMTADEFRECL